MSWILTDIGRNFHACLDALAMLDSVSRGGWPPASWSSEGYDVDFDNAGLSIRFLYEDLAPTVYPIDHARDVLESYWSFLAGLPEKGYVTRQFRPDLPEREADLLLWEKAWYTRHPYRGRIGIPLDDPSSHVRGARFIGFYDELDPRSAFTQGSIREVLSDAPQRDEDSIADYLDAGHVIIDFLEDVRDVIGGERVLPAASVVKSDNVWIWRNDLSYYVRTYHVRLPEEFISHVRGNGFAVPPMVIPELVNRTSEYHSRGR